MSAVIRACTLAAGQAALALVDGCGCALDSDVPAHGAPRTGEASETGEYAPQPSSLAYVEVVVTLPASEGEGLDPWAVDDLRHDIVCALERAGAERATAILLVNPGEIVPRLTVLALVDDEPAAAEVAARRSGPGELIQGAVSAALADRVQGFVLVQPVTVAPPGDTPTSTLTPRQVTSRVDVLLAMGDEYTPTDERGDE